MHMLGILVADICMYMYNYHTTILFYLSLCDKIKLT